MKWLFLDNEIKEPINDIYGFVYLLEFKDEENNIKYYIGKKNFFEYKELKALNNGKKRNGHIKFINHRKDGKLVKYELIKKESNWKEYTGSIKSDISDLKLVEKTILMFAESKRHLTYLEAKMLFKFDVLENEEFLNENILGKFFKVNIK